MLRPGALKIARIVAPLSEVKSPLKSPHYITQRKKGCLCPPVMLGHLPHSVEFDGEGGGASLPLTMWIPKWNRGEMNRVVTNTCPLQDFCSLLFQLFQEQEIKEAITRIWVLWSLICIKYFYFGLESPSLKKLSSCEYFLLYLFFFQFLFFKLVYSCSCQLLLYSRVNQPYVFLCPTFLAFLPIWVITEHQVGFPVLYSRFSLVLYFIHSIHSVYMSIQTSQFILPPLCSLHLCFYFCFVTKIICTIRIWVISKVEGKRRFKKFV